MRIAIVGCGAIASEEHAPAIRALNDITISIAIDAIEKHAISFAERFNVARASTDLSLVRTYADAAIVAVPPAQHAATTIQLLKDGVHVLVEKPMAPTVIECKLMIEAAHSNSAVLAVGLVRRFFAADRAVRLLLHSEALGKAKSFNIEDGYPYAWPARTNFIVHKRDAGGGVLLGLGSHNVDRVLWWFGDPIATQYESNSEGGMETDCIIRMQYKNGFEGTVELSRTRRLRNCATIKFENGLLESTNAGDDLSLEMAIADEPRMLLSGSVRHSNSDLPANAFSYQILEFVKSINGGGGVIVDGAEGIRSIKYIEDCYAHARPLQTYKVFPIQLGGATSTWI